MPIFVIAARIVVRLSGMRHKAPLAEVDRDASGSSP
jgi:hypothetical protein